MYKDLDQFAGFFNEDWQLDYAGPDEAIAAFARDQSADTVRRLLSELDELLASSLSESEMYDLWIMGCSASYDPTEDGLTYREWFAHVRDVLTRPPG